MNWTKTALLLAAMTSLFVGIGWLIGGATGMVIAFVVALGMNVFAYWNSDKMVLHMYGAQEIAERDDPTSSAWCASSRAAPRSRCRRSTSMREPAAERVRDRPRSRARRRRRHDRHYCSVLIARRTGGRARARARAHQEPRHADHDGHGDDRRRDLDAREFRVVLRLGRQPQQPDGHHRLDRDRDSWRRSPRCSCRWRSAARANTKPTRIGAEIAGQPLWLASRAREHSVVGAARRRTRRPSAIRRPRTCSSSIRSPAMAWTTSSRPIRRPRTASRGLQAMAQGMYGAAQKRRAGTLGLKPTTANRPPTPKAWRAQSGARCAARHLLQRTPARRSARTDRRQSAISSRATSAFARTIVMMVLRRLGQIDAVHRELLARAAARPRRPRRDRSCASQPPRLLFLDVAPHASVEFGRRRSPTATDRARHFKGLINAVARKIATEGKAAARDARMPTASTRRSGPGTHGPRPTAKTPRAPSAKRTSIEPPLDITVKGDAAAWAERLEAELLPTGTLRRAAGGRIEDLPGYSDGAWWIQDAAAAMPVTSARRRQGQDRHRPLRRARRQDRAARGRRRERHRRRSRLRAPEARARRISRA